MSDKTRPGAGDAASSNNAENKERRVSVKSANIAQSWRDVLPVHPAAELFPKMSDAELRELGEDIKKHGLKISIAFRLIEDGKDNVGMPRYRQEVLDGRNRLDAMELVGLKTVAIEDGHYVCIVGKRVDDEVDPYAYVVSANIHRRHLTPEKKRELIGKLLKENPEKSNRQIAEAVKASHHTVEAVRTEMVSTGQVAQLIKTVGKDGKRRKPPAKSKRGVNAKLPAKPDPSHALKACIDRVKITVEQAIGAKRGDAEHQALVFASVRECLDEMESARR